MQIDTFYLFLSYIKQLRNDLILDVGSLDGRNALQFKYAVPGADVVAIEANPCNFQTLKKIEEKGIDCRNFAASNFDGNADFYIYNVDYESESANKGMSSLLSAHDPRNVKEIINVEVKRLDGFIGTHYGKSRDIALWIDVEGAGYEVLEGIGNIMDRVRLVHVEVDRIENRKGQRFEADVDRLMEECGFRRKAASYDPGGTFGDVIFVRDSVRLNEYRPVLMYFLMDRMKLQKIASLVLPKGFYERIREFYCKFMA